MPMFSQGKQENRPWPVFSYLLAEWTGLEPATPGVTGRYSNQLNYHSAAVAAFRPKPQVLPDLPNLPRGRLASPRGFEPLLQP